MAEQNYELDGPTDFFFPYPVRTTGQVIVSVVPGGVLPQSSYQIIGASSTATGVTIRWKDAPRDGSATLNIQRRTAPLRVSNFLSDLSITATALNGEFNNILQIVQDGVVNEFRGAWVTERLYLVLDVIVGPDDNIYVAQEQHTSDVFATDLTAEKWLLAADFSTGQSNIDAALAAAIVARNKAEDWADEAEDVPVETGQFSAKHHAIKSAASAGASSTSATNSENSAIASAGSATDAADALYDFKGRWLGGLASDPTVDLNGDPLNAGDAFFNTTENKLKVYNGATWQVSTASAADVGIDATGLNTSATSVQQAVEAALIGRKNAIINGNFAIWQRGASQTTSGYGSDDRWRNLNIGSTKTHSRQSFTLGQTDVPNEPTFFSRTAVNSVAGAGNLTTKQQRIEGVRSFAGQTVTLSFYAKADAAKNIAVEFAQTFGTDGTPSASVIEIGAQLVALTTAWQKHTITVDIPSIAGKTLGASDNDFLQLTLWFDAGSNYNARVANLGQQSGTFDIAQVQLEKGSVATDFEQRPIGEELALCQRYYETNPPLILKNTGGTLTEIFMNWAFSEAKRVSPTVISPFTTAASGIGGTVLRTDVAAGAAVALSAGAASAGAEL